MIKELISVSHIPELELGNELQQMFSMQLQSNEQEIGNRKEIRIALNDFVRELIYPWESYKNTVKKLVGEGLKTTGKISHLHDFNWEMSLCVERLIQLMVVSNIGPSDLLNYYETLLKEVAMEQFFYKDNILQTIMQYSRYCNICGKIYNNPEINLRLSVYDIEKKALGIPESEKFFLAGRIINDQFLDLYTQQVWDTNFHFQKASFKLDMIENANGEKDFHNQLMEGWLHYFRMMDLLGHDWDSIGRLFSIGAYRSKIKI